MMKRTLSLFALLSVLFLGACTPAGPAKPANPEIILATTTSTRDSGLLDVLMPDFEEKTGYTVKIIAVGTGAALAMGEKGDADVLLVMHNDFVIVGPADDPAAIKGTAKAANALGKVAQAQALFLSRGDDSGTNKKELALWSEANIQPEGAWYQESGQGMGATLKIASEKGAYTMTDRATYLNMQENLDLVVLVEGDDELYNVYHVMVVNPEKHAGVNEAGAKALADFLTAPDTQAVIGEYGKDRFGQPLFFPDAGK